MCRLCGRREIALLFILFLLAWVGIAHAANPQIIAGEYFSVALKNNGTVWAWGHNRYGQLGNGTTEWTSFPEKIETIAGANSISAGQYHILILKEDGTLWAAGFNSSGQLGDGTTNNRYLPVQVNGLTDVIDVAAGASNSIALKNDGTVWGWGQGFGLTPVQISGLSDIASVSGSSGDYAYALSNDGTVWIISAGSASPAMNEIVAISGGRDHALVVKTDGTVWAWGSNEHGQLGNGTTVFSGSPVQVTGLTEIVSVATYQDHSLALKNDGTVWAWGDNWAGQLGDGTIIDRTIPVQVTGLTDVDAITTGLTHSMAIKNDGSVWGWGDNHVGQLGNGSTTSRFSPSSLGALSDIVDVEAGFYHAVAVKDDGTVMTWGSNGEQATLGDGTKVNRWAPVQTLGLSDVIKVAAIGNSTVALKSDGSVWGWGGPVYGYLQPPVQISGLSDVSAIAAGNVHGLALKNDQTVWAWGHNVDGKVGDGTNEYRGTTAVQVIGLSDVMAIAAGAQHSLALKTDGTVWAWGSNVYGQLGDGSQNDRWAPVQVNGISDVVAIGAGRFNSFAIKSDGTVWGWGRNDYGQLGSGSTSTYQSMPVQAIGLSDVAAIYPGFQDTLALKNDGSVWGWGKNSYGQIGDGTAASRAVPAPVEELSDISKIEAAGLFFNIALKDDGSVLTWGSNRNGALGLGEPSGIPTEASINLLNNGGSEVASNPVQLTTNPEIDRNPDWSPDGSKLAFHSLRSGNYDVWTIDSDGSNPTQITTSSASDISPQWSPDGSTLVYESFESGSPDIWLINNDGTNPRQLTFDSFLDEQPTFSPDGTKIAFTSNRGGNTNIWIMDADGTNPMQVTTNVRDRSPAWSPDGSKIAFQSGEEGNVDIWVINADSTNQIQLTTSSGSDVLPAWSPDGTRIAFHSTRSGGHDIWIMDADGNNQVQMIPDDPDDDVQPAWSPDGTHIAFGSDRAGDTDIWVYQLGESSNLDTDGDGMPDDYELAQGFNPFDALDAGQDPDDDGLTNLEEYQRGSDPLTPDSATPQVVAGGTGGFSLALSSDGRVWSWGRNRYGQLGRGIIGSVDAELFTPSPLADFNDVSALAAGNEHALALKTDGSVWAWGRNQVGQLGDGSTVDESAPIPVGGLPEIATVAAGGWSSLALGTDGTVWGWGSNYGMTPVQFFSGVKAIAGGYSFALMVKDDGTVWYGYSGWQQQITGLSNIVAVAAGQNHYLALKDDGTVWAWGDNSYGQLGNGSGTGYYGDPVQVAGLGGVVSISASDNHSLAAKADGTVWAWGNNWAGQLGNGSIENSSVPVQVQGLSEVTSASTGSFMSLAVKKDGSLWSWGGVPGVMERSSPVQISGFSAAQGAAAGYYHSVVLKGDGTVWTWGYNQLGALGDGMRTNRWSPVQALGLSGIAQLASSGNNNLALGADGTLWNWGYSYYSSYENPQPGPSLPSVTEIAVGSRHDVALTADGTVWSWGINGNGQLGNGTNLDQPDPVSVLSNAVAIAAGENHTVALTADGTVWTWGDNAYGQLGDGTQEERSLPTAVMSDISKVWAGRYTTFAQAEDGTFWAWGSNNYGQLGDGTTIDRPAPVPVSGLSGNFELFPGFQSAYALAPDGTVWAWGRNNYGQLGIGASDKIDRLVPEAVPGLTGFAKIWPGLFHNVGVKADGTIWTWGRNLYGELGIGPPSGVPAQMTLNLLNPDVDTDTDGDGIDDSTDNCIEIFNPDQTNLDNDGLGDACDADDDNDGMLDAEEAALGTDPNNPDSDGDKLWDGSDPDPLVVNANLLWAGVQHITQADGSEIDSLEIGVSQSDTTSLGGLSAGVTGPNGFSYTFSDSDVHPYLPGQLALWVHFDNLNPLEEGIYTFTVTDSAGGSVSQNDLHVDPQAVPRVDESTITYQRMADGSYRFDWAPVEAARIYYYRFRIYDGPNSEVMVYNSAREALTYEDVPAGLLQDGVTYWVRVEAHETPSWDLLKNRSNSGRLAVTPLASDYDPLQVTVNDTLIFNLIDNWGGGWQTGLRINVDAEDAISFAEVSGPNDFHYVYDLTADRVHGPAAELWKSFDPATLTAGVYTFHFVANGRDYYHYSTVTSPVNYQVPNPSTQQVEDLGNGYLRFSWAPIEQPVPIWYGIRVTNQSTGQTSSVPGHSGEYLDRPQVDVPLSELEAKIGSGNWTWSVRVYDSSDRDTIRNLIVGPEVVFDAPPFDPSRPRITPFVSHRITGTGADRTYYWADCTYAENDLAQLQIAGPAGSGIGFDLMREGDLYLGSNYRGYLLSDPGLPEPGLYTFTATDASGRQTVRYDYQSPATDYDPIDFRTVHIDQLANGQLRISWAPVAAGVPLHYRVEFHTLADHNGDGYPDEALLSPYQTKTSWTFNPAQLPNEALAFRIRAREYPGGVNWNNRTHSIYVGYEGPEFDYGSLTDIDGDGFADNVDFYGAGDENSVATGTDVNVTPLQDIQVVFDTVSTGGTLNVVSLSIPDPPANFKLVTGASFEISTSATFSGSATVCLGYSDAALEDQNSEADLRLFHHNGQSWEDITTSVDTANNRVCGETTSFSPFAVGEPVGGPFSITATAGTGGSISPAGVTEVASGGSQTYAITPDPGYQIQNVIAHNYIQGPVDTYTFTDVTSDRTISASFVPVQFTITASATEGGTISLEGDTSYSYGSTPTYYATSAAGYYLADVLVDNVSVGAVRPYTFAPLEGDHTIDAIFAPAPTYTVSASAGTDGSVTPSGDTVVTEGFNQAYSIVPAAGYRIGSVLVDGANKGVQTSWSFNNVTADHTLVANFISDLYTLTATAGTGGSISPAGATTVPAGGNQTYNFTPDTGYKVSNVVVQGVSKGALDSYTFSDVQGDRSINVSFTPLRYTITATSTAGGSISLEGIEEYNHGATPSYYANAADGYHLKDVEVDGVSVGAVRPYTFAPLTGPHTIHAIFDDSPTWTISASAGTGGSVTPAGNSVVVEGSSQGYTITANDGYVIESVIVDGTDIGTPTSYSFNNVTASHTLTAQFAVDQSQVSGDGTLKLVWAECDNYPGNKPVSGDSASWTIRAGSRSGPVVATGHSSGNWSGINNVVVPVSPAGYYVSIDWYWAEEDWDDQTTFSNVQVTSDGQVVRLSY